MRMIRKPAFFAGACIAAALIAACSDTPTSATQPSIKGTRASFAAGAIPAGSLEIQKVKICKDVSSPPGTYSFTVSGNANPVLVDAGQCVTVLTVTVPTPAGVTVSENSKTGVQFDSVAFDKIDAAGANTVGVSTTNSQTGYANQFHGSVFNYYNSAVPQGGCTFTKGWYRNNGANTIKGVDGISISWEGQIFAATPGKPGNVAWDGSNDLLNLYQQLLAALENGGATGPASVQQAIIDAQNGTSVALVSGKITISTNLSQTEISNLIDALTNFNEGKLAGFPHCG